MRRTLPLSLLLAALGCGAKETPPSTAKTSTQEAAATIESVAKELGIELSTLEEPEVLRGGSDRAAVEPLYPRGDVRIGDLDDFRVDVTSDFDDKGTLSFRAGGKVLYEREFEPTDFQTIASVYEEVRSQLKPGTKVTWGFYPEKGNSATAEFTVVDEDKRLKARIEEVDRKFGDANSYAATAMRAQLYLNSRLYFAAYREAQRAATMGSENAAQAFAVMQASLRQMKLHKTELWDEVEGKAAGVKGRRAAAALLR